MERLCKAVDQYLIDKILIGSSVYVEPPQSDDLWQLIYIRIIVHVVETYNRTSVRQQVEDVIRTILDYDIVDFGTRVTMGSIYRAVLSVAGVEWAELRWLSDEEPPDIDPEAPIGGGGGNTSPLLSGEWQFDSSTSTGDPGTQRGQGQRHQCDHPHHAVQEHHQRHRQGTQLAASRSVTRSSCARC